MSVEEQIKKFRKRLEHLDARFVKRDIGHNPLAVVSQGDIHELFSKLIDILDQLSRGEPT